MHPEDLTIVVIDDETAIVDLAATILNDAGFPTQGTTDPDEALRLIEAHPTVKVLLSDVMMSRTTGPEVVRRAQKIRGGDLRVVFMTGGFEGVRFRQSDRILAKPWSREELVSEIQRVLSDAPKSVSWDGQERRRLAA